MTQFVIHITKNGLFKFRYVLNTRFKPMLIQGRSHATRNDCIAEIKEIQKSMILSDKIAFKYNQTGYWFSVLSSEGTTIALSRIFPEPELMMRMLAILQLHSGNANITNSKCISRYSTAA